ncbi:response regulator transcription factor [Streptomyces sp. NBC_00859]|uniref:response regulator transcription factor n=1 Tax=Streptomyces sp. NBC_00859 TaxID=2903682 RepID=UPI00386D1357
MKTASAPPPQVPLVPRGPDGLTARENHVLRLIVQGQTNQEIARTLLVTEATVQTHINRIFAKTGGRDRAAAVHYARTRGLAERPAPG